MGVERRRAAVIDNDDASRVARNGTPHVPRDVQELVAHQRGPGMPSSVHSLQRLAGNGATGALVQRLAVQRDDDLVTSLDKGAGGPDPYLPAINQTSGAWNLDNAWNQKTDAIAGTNEAGVVGSSIATPLSGLAMVTSSMQHHGARTALKAATQGTLDHRVATRDVNTSGANVAQNTMKTASGITDVTQGAMNIAGHAGASVATSVAAFVTVPLNIFQAVREGLRAHKARMRAAQLEGVINDWQSSAQQKLDAAKQSADQLAEAEAGAFDVMVALRRQLFAARPSLKPGLQLKLDEATTAWNLAKQAAEDAQTRLRAVQSEKQSMEEAVKRAAKNANGGATVAEIAAYALGKNHAGFIKKALTSFGASLGAAGGIVLGVAAAAGGAALMATPFGWALASLAAAAGIGLATYKAWKFFSKRWQRTDQTKSFGARLKETLSFWKTVGKSDREKYAEQLWDLADAGSDREEQERAQKLVDTLLRPTANGWNLVKTDRTKGIKLLMAKMAS